MNGERLDMRGEARINSTRKVDNKRKGMFPKHSYRLAAVPLALALAYMASRCSDARRAWCRPVPDLYGDWAHASDLPDTLPGSIRAIVEPRRALVERLPDVFSRLWSKDSAQLAEEGEWIAWRDDSVMVVVPSPTDEAPLVVVPRKAAPFLSDLSGSLRDRLARVAAAAADALASAGDRTCDDAARTMIRVGPPEAVRLRQLQVLVQPQPPLRVADEAVFYRRLEEALQQRLGKAP